MPFDDYEIDRDKWTFVIRIYLTEAVFNVYTGNHTFICSDNHFNIKLKKDINKKVLISLTWSLRSQDTNYSIEKL